jgi:membrane protease subunit HflC
METLSNLNSPPVEAGTSPLVVKASHPKMFNQAKPFTDGFGIELIDIVVRQIRYSDDLTESVYQRMIKERNQIAEAYRSYGRGQLAQWQGKTESEQRQILSAAYATSETIKGIADARAAEIYSEAYEADPEFFELWRTLESYRKTIPALNKILSTDMQYFDILYGKESQ